MFRQLGDDSYKYCQILRKLRLRISSKNDYSFLKGSNFSWNSVIDGSHRTQGLCLQMVIFVLFGSNSIHDSVFSLQQGWTPAQVARHQHYLNIFEVLAKVTTNVTDWEMPSIQGAGLNGVSDVDPSLLGVPMILDNPAQMLDRFVIESEDESKFCAPLEEARQKKLDYRKQNN